MRTKEKIAKLLCICAEVGEQRKTCSNNEDGCNNIKCRDYREYLTAKRAIGMAQEWISVKDELPEDDIRVLTKLTTKPVPIVVVGSFIDGRWSHGRQVEFWRPIEIE
ncbi:hypothetical protein FACS189434_13320 [Bacteroidia bacterium]|nr:hypothetical protein FACS189434_13320 [Bacteroidia bacterium]